MIIPTTLHQILPYVGDIVVIIAAVALVASLVATWLGLKSAPVSYDGDKVLLQVRIDKGKSEAFEVTEKQAQRLKTVLERNARLNKRTLGKVKENRKATAMH